MIIRDGDAVQLALLVLERFAFDEGSFQTGDALLIASTIRLLAENAPARTIKMPEVRLARTLHYGHRRGGSREARG